MAACKQCKEKISMGEGLRHSVISALAEVLPERPLRAHTRHRDGRSLDAYASGARPDYAALVAKVSPEFPPSFPRVVLAIRKHLESKRKMVEAAGIELGR